MLAVLLAALVNLGPAGELHLRIEVDAAQVTRSNVPEEGTEFVRSETSVSPRLALLTDGRLQLRLSYEPQVLTATDLAGTSPELQGSFADRTVLLHRASGGIEYTLPRWRLGLSSSVSAGETLLLAGALEEEEDRPPEAVSTTSRIPYLGYEVAATAVRQLSRATALTMIAGFRESGTTEPSLRERLPSMLGLNAGATLAYAYTQRHTLGLEASASYTYLGAGAPEWNETLIVRAGGSSLYQLGRPTSLRTAAGLAYTQERLAHPDAPSTLPWAEGALEYAPGPTLPVSRLTIGLEPAADRLTGALDMRTSALGTVDWAPFRRWRFGIRGSTSASFSLDGRIYDRGGPHTTVHNVGIGASHDLTHDLHLTALAGSTWQLTERSDLPEFREDLVQLLLAARLFSY